MTPRTLKGMNLFVDGKGHAGKVDELTLPTLKRKTVEHQAGGMPAPVAIDMGMEKLEAGFTLQDFDPQILALFGLFSEDGTSVRFKGSLANNDGSGTEIPVEVAMRGHFSQVDMGTWKAAEAAPIKIDVAVIYYKYQQGGHDIIEIDPLNHVEKINGIDRLASRRANLGIA